MSGWIKGVAVAAVLALAAGGASAQVSPAGLPGSSSELRAEFDATLALTVGSSQHVATSQGEVLDRFAPDGRRRLTVAVRAVQAPLLLRPFKGSIASVTSELITTQSEDPRSLDGYDMATLERRSDGTVVMGGVRTDIVDEVIRRQAQPGSSGTPEFREAMARALLVSPSLRDSLRRSGPPYAFRAITDEAGRLLESSVLYDWGTVDSRLAYTTAEGRTVLGRMSLDLRGQVGGLGRVTGRMTVVFSNYAIALAHAGTGR